MGGGQPPSKKNMALKKCTKISFNYAEIRIKETYVFRENKFFPLNFSEFTSESAKSPLN